MHDWSEIFSRFKKLNILIIGDVMVDAYIWGAVDRISPEAPVPVIHVRNRDYRLGGAANVALNVQSLGANPILVCLAGDDDYGQRLMNLMGDKGLSRDGVVVTRQRPTTIKARVIAAHQHVVRIDDESDQVATPREEQELLLRIEKLLPSCDAVIFEDYDKGVITSSLISKAVSMANERGIPTVVDPKKRNFLHYNNVTLFKPNLKELREGLKIDVDARENQSVDQAVTTLKTRLKASGVMLTLSEFGIYIDYQGQKLRIPAHKREIADVSGAGDTVVSVAALCVALQLPPDAIAALSNLGGGLVCQHVGVVPIDRDELLEEAKALN
ncbi:MAG: D-glycero-beta-D-manno-heptose-7-phosphate kinase [Bacteroidetes bacterium]|nr:D-glycero-beta-D-manno-heptose-7-phosphate kinase [Bacteroidota bacterium]